MAQNSTFRILVGSAADACGERPSIAITVSEGRITGLSPWNSSTRSEAGDVDARDAIAMPGFIDIHVHGGAGRAVMEGTDDAIQAISLHLAQYGVTGYLPTTVTAPWELQSRALRVTAAAMASPENGIHGAAILGCHLEGPYINPRKKGAQPAQFILPPDIEDLKRHTGENLDAVRIVTLAPEMPGALDLIRFLASRGIIASLGHTDATYDEVSAAIDAGARHVTHCFNAMRPMEGREPGVVGAALSRPELAAELIWDNIHVHPASCGALVAAKGVDRVLFISDGIPGAGMPDGTSFSLGDLPVSVKNGAARLPDGTLAGSLLTLDQAFRNAARFSLPERAAMTSRNAAVALGLGHRKGLLVPGYDADIVLLDRFGSLLMTFIGGKSFLP